MAVGRIKDRVVQFSRDIEMIITFVLFLVLDMAAAAEDVLVRSISVDILNVIAMFVRILVVVVSEIEWICTVSVYIFILTDLVPHLHLGFSESSSWIAGMIFLVTSEQVI